MMFKEIALALINLIEPYKNTLIYALVTIHIRRTSLLWIHFFSESHCFLYLWKVYKNQHK